MRYPIVFLVDIVGVGSREEGVRLTGLSKDAVEKKKMKRNKWRLIVDQQCGRQLRHRVHALWYVVMIVVVPSRVRHVVPPATYTPYNVQPLQHSPPATVTPCNVQPLHPPPSPSHHLFCVITF